MEQDYYSWKRDDILSLIPASSRSALSVGCGAGVTEGCLVERGMSVTGIEIHEESAKRAKERGVSVINEPAESGLKLLASESFDCVIFADVLEHMYDPQAILESTCELLEDGGVAIVSVPNFRHVSVLWDLFFLGEIVYQPAGILDRDHIRMTTAKMVERWFRKCELQVIEKQYVTFQRREELLKSLSMGFLSEFVARQILFVARK